VSEVLKTQSICIFPEGTSTDGKSLRPFKPNLFEAAVTADVPVYTLAIRYLSGVSGQWSDVPAFIGEMTLLESIGKILKNRNLIVELSFFPPPGSTPQQPGDRKWLALHSYEQISKYLGATNSL
jgi:1-acyl-sn-glycerol-3-phosphate acyltransferase